VKVLGIIPARGGSKAIPRKNLALLGDRSLLEWACVAATHSNLNRVVISTDDVEIASLGAALGAEVPFLRPPELSGDTAPTIDAVLHAIDSLLEQYDAVMVLQPTTPFRTTEDINKCLALLNESNADSVISVVDVGGHHPARMKYIDDGFLVDPPFAELGENQRRQELRRMYLRNGAVYLTRTEIVRRGTLKGERSLAYVMPAERSINIDEPFDLMVAQALFQSGFILRE
jgi:N-acylneuraminate cytidylyltransferase